MTFSRNEYPRPQFRRDCWQSLNGEWQFDFIDSVEAVDINMPLDKVINVPFSYQWGASGINDKSVHDRMLYRRSFVIDEQNSSKNALLCFNASDYATTVWINGKLVTTHIGGYTPFGVDITDVLIDGQNQIAVLCVDTLDDTIPRGKQSKTGEPFTCFYYPNSGIWQSVWIEFFDKDCIESRHIYSDFDSKSICGTIATQNGIANKLRVDVSFDGKLIFTQNYSLNGKNVHFNLALEHFDSMLWSCDNPNLVYVDLMLYHDETLCDVVHTRIGLRKISIEDGIIKLNGQPLYQRLILDQGYWNESGITPPSAEALKKDIMLAMEMGFNGARKHQKFEDSYFYYYAEELGFLVWCEMPSAYNYCEKEVKAVSLEWQDIVKEARNYTSVIAYVPLNESWGVEQIRTDKAQQEFARQLYFETKALDDSRIISTNDGFENVEDSDILSIHDYDIKQAEEFKTKYTGVYDGMKPQGFALFCDGHKYNGQPVLFTEFGGIAFVGDQKDGAWGYGYGASGVRELLTRLKQLMDGILSTEFQGYCYTQLTDVQQEVNGLLYANRTPKCSLESYKKLFGKNPTKYRK